MSDSSPTAALESQDTGNRLAAIDIGSNSVRLVVAQAVNSDGYRVLDEERANTRLAADLARTGKLGEEAMADSLEALKNFLTIAAGHGVENTRAIATSAVRDAKNGAEFRQRVQDELGLEIEVISALEEARLAFLSVARAFDVAGKQVAVADIGGGSTEIILASSGMIDEVYATRLGAVRVTEKCKLGEKISESQLKSAAKFVDRQLKKHAKHPSLVPAMLYGTGGTFTAMAAMISAREGQSGAPLYGYRVKRAAVNHLLSDLAGMTLESRSKVAGLNPRRADIIVAGLLVIDRILRHLGVNVVQVHTRGVRDGLLLDMIQAKHCQQQGSRPAPTSAERYAAAEQFAESCGVELPHAHQVARIAGKLLDGLAAPLGFTPADAQLIQVAAVLANVGYLINFDKHHKHSYQLILNSELRGFERHELQLLACIARYHRGSLPKRKHPGYGDLSEADQLRVSKLAALLRLALALDRTHQQQVEDLKCKVTRNQVVIEVAAKENADVDIWAARRKVDLFEKVFRRQVIFTTPSETPTNSATPQQ